MTDDTLGGSMRMMDVTVHFRAVQHARWMRSALPFVGLAMLVGAFGASCERPEPEVQSYFDRTIAPILRGSCSRQTTGCHVEDARGNAVGNLDTTSYEKLARRRDLLLTYGPYPYPGLLQKVIEPQAIEVHGLDGKTAVRTDIRHAAAAGLDVGSDGFATLLRWLQNGATKSNVGSISTTPVAAGPCRSTMPAGTPDPGTAFEMFVSKVQPVLRKSCSAGTCHGAESADFALTCGDDEAGQKWNAQNAAQFLADPIESSELLRRGLAPEAGGTWHAGGAIFKSTSDEGYQALLEWAKAHGPPKIVADEAYRFFADRVQPVLVRKGCMFMGCHSSLSFHELPLRGGSGGRFSAVATKHNYELARKMLALESADPRASRLLAKNLFPFDRALDPNGVGIVHRGGPLFEDVPGVDRATPAACDGVDVEKGDLSTIPGYCVIVGWQKKERQKALAAGLVEDLSAIYYVSRPPDRDVPQDFDTYRPGARLHRAEASLDDAGHVVLAADAIVDCGLDPAQSDIRRPAVSIDGKRVAFAARTSKDAPLSIYVIDGASCAREPTIAAHAASEKGILLHDFDPAWAPDGRLVFASTRGAIGQSDLDYSGPTRTPDGLKPNANLYVLEGGKIRQLTFLLGQELAPSFKRNGQLIFTTEKRAPGFYQLAARRLNLDGSDYHPLYGQRKSVGFEQLIDVHQLANGDFVGVFSDRGALARGGALGLANRSLGPDQIDRDPNDRFFLHSLTIVDGTGKPGIAGSIYRSPSPLPGPSFLASWAPSADVGAFDGAYRLVQIDVPSGARRELVTVAGASIVDAVAVYARAGREAFVPGTESFHIDAGMRDAEVRNLDLPMLASLFFDNRRVGRTIDERLHGIGVLESLPPPDGLLSLDAADPAFVATDSYGKMWVKRRRLGFAPMLKDASLAWRIPGGMPFVLELAEDAQNAPFAVVAEENQLYPGERAKASFRRQLFDGNCGGCHGAVSGRDTDARLLPDVVTEASRVLAVDEPAFDLFKAPADRGVVKGP